MLLDKCGLGDLLLEQKMKKKSIIAFVISLVKRDMKEYSVDEKDEIEVYNKMKLKLGKEGPQSYAEYMNAFNNDKPEYHTWVAKMKKIL